MRNYQPKDYELTAFYYSLGQAVSEGQKFEYLVAVVLCVVKSEEFFSIEDAWNALEVDFKKTLGRLILALNKEVFFVETFRYHLSEIVHDRNWIVHKIPRGMYLFLQEKYEFDRLISRLSSFKDSSRSIRLMLEEWFLGNEKYKSRIDSLPPEVMQNLMAMKNV